MYLLEPLDSQENGHGLARTKRDLMIKADLKYYMVELMKQGKWNNGRWT